MGTNRMQKHRLFFLILFCYIGLTGILIFRFPAFSGPNEDMHYEYIALLRQNGRLPDPTTSHRADERHQPPVYYTTAALFNLPFTNTKLDTDYPKNPYYTATFQGNLNRFIHVTPQNAPELYVSRFVSMLFGVMALISIYLGAQLTLPLPISLFIVSLVAFQPTFLQLSATVNNDLAATALSALLIAYTTYLLQKEKGPRAYLLWGVIFALAMLTKASVVFLFLALLISCWTIWQTQKKGKTAVFGGILGVMTFLPLWSVWLVFNQMRAQDALGISASLPLTHLLTLKLPDFILLLPRMGELFRSFWLDWSPGMLGYAPWWFYIIWGILLLVAFTGWFRQTAAAVSQPLSVLRLHLFWTVSLTGGFLAVKTLMIRGVGFLVPEGRWLLPILPSLAWLAGTGLARWISPRQQTQLLKFAAAIPLLSAFILLFLFFPTLYPKAERLASVKAIPTTIKPANLTYNQQVMLLGLESGSLTVDEYTKIALYWQVLRTPTTDYTVSAQLLNFKDSEWVPLSIQNSYPGSGLNPTGDWQAGEFYRDQLILRPKGELNGPTNARLILSLSGGDHENSIEQNGRSVDWPVAAEVIVRPASPLPLPSASGRLISPVNFGGLFDLAALTHTFVGNELSVTLWWHAVADISDDYTIFVHLLDQQGQLLTQSDTIPANGTSPTHIWQAEDVIIDQHRLTVAPHTEMIILVGAYDAQTFTRLPAMQDGDMLPDNIWRHVIR